VRVRNMLLSSFALFFVSLSFSSAQKIELKDGIRSVHNEKIGKLGGNPQVSLALIRTLGGIDVEDENLAFNLPYDVDMDGQGNLYILDTGNCRIQKFTPEGKFLATLGRQGQGPGEFQSPYSLDIDSEGYLYVSDMLSKKVHILTPKGKARKTLKITKHRVYKARLIKPGLIVMGGFVTRRISQKEKKLPKLLKVFNTKGKLQYEFGDMMDYKDNWLSLWANWHHFDLDKDGYAYLTFRHQNRIEKYSPDGQLIWRADRNLNYGTKPMDKGLSQGRTRQIPKMNTVSTGISPDEKGRIWVLTLNRQLRREEQQSVITGGGARITKRADVDREKTDVYKLEIFDSDGILLGEIRLGHHAHDIRIIKNYLFIWERNNAKIYQYEIKEEQGS
jgi:hypothetical protein